MMTTSDWIAGGALAVSLISLYLSNKSLKNSKVATEASQAIRTAEAKSELLAILSECRAVLNRTRIDIGALKAIYDNEKQPVQVLLQNFISLFTEYLPTVETALAQVEADWKSVQSWANEISVSDILRRKSDFQDNLKDYENAHEQAVRLIEEFRHVFAKATRYIDN